MSTAENTPESWAEQLQAQGIDPASFLRTASEAAQRAAGEQAERAPELLATLAAFAEQVHAAGFTLYFPFESDVPPLAKVFAGEPDAFLRALDDLSAVATALGERATKTIQRGVPCAAHVAGPERGWILQGALRLARALGEAGIDPGDTLLQGVPAVVEATGGEPGPTVAAFAALEAFVLEIAAFGIHPTWPIQEGVRGTAEAWADDLEELPDALGDLADLVAALHGADVSPYPVLEYGISAALPPTRERAWLRREVFPLAATLASHGINPTPTLHEGIGPLAYLPEDRARETLAWAQELAADGIDPGWFLAYGLHHTSSVTEDDPTFTRLLQGVDALARAIAAHDHQPMLSFRYGLPELIGRLDLERVLALATDLANLGIDPGPPLKNGFGTVAYQCAERPQVAEAALELARALIDAGRSPWRTLENGLPAALSAAGGDDVAAVDLLAQLGELLTQLHARGIDTDKLLLYGIYPLGSSARGDRALFETLLGFLTDLVADLSAAGIDPVRTVGTGLPEVAKAAQGDRALLERAVAFARDLAAEGIDPAPLLTRALPTLTGEKQVLLQPIAALCRAVRAAEIDTAPLGQAIAALSKADGSAIADALATATTIATHGVDPALALERAVPGLLEIAPAETRQPALAALAEALRAARARSLPSDGLDDSAFARAIEVTGAAPEALAHAFATVLDAAARVAEAAPSMLTRFLRQGSSAAAQVAGARPDVFATLMARLAGWTHEHAAAPGLDSALFHGLSAVAAAAGDDPEALSALLPPLSALAHLDEATALLEHVLPAARLGAGRDAHSFKGALEDVRRLGAAGVDPGLLHRIKQLTPLVRRLPAAWSELIVPACLGVGAGAPAVLDGIRYLERYLREPGDLVIIKEIATRHGVRAPDLLSGLLLAGLRQGRITSLSDERELLLSFLAEVPFPDPDYYAEYRRIMTDPEASPAERRSQVEALHTQLQTITEAVVAGQLSTAQEQHPLFAQVLTYVFPPARSVSRRGYLSLYQRFPDRPADLTDLAERGALPAPEVRLATGGYRIRAGDEIDTAPWEPLRAAVASVPTPPSPDGADAPAELGQALFEAWIAGDLGKTRTRDALLTRIYKLHRAVDAGLPDALDDAAAFLKYREFLSDTAREITQDALAAFRAAQPDRYERQARAKLDSRRQPGKGLLRGVWRTIVACQSGALSREAALERLDRQLKGYDLSGADAQEALFSATEPALPELIAGLPAREREVALGEEHTRVLADLVGGELAAMQRELFGEGAGSGKLEYSRDGGGPELVLRIEPTKRKAHAPVGLCEGVCTATDQQLWETPAFLQCVFWGPDGRARGGVHLLRVERDVDGAEERALSLPGINPTLELLREVGAEAILDAALEFARALAEAWKLDAVWIPTHRGIASNRGPIRQLLEQRALPTQKVESVRFSYSPYGYTFDEVWVV